MNELNNLDEFSLIRLACSLGIETSGIKSAKSLGVLTSSIGYVKNGEKLVYEIAKSDIQESLSKCFVLEVFVKQGDKIKDVIQTLSSKYNFQFINGVDYTFNHETTVDFNGGRSLTYTVDTEVDSIFWKGSLTFSMLNHDFFITGDDQLQNLTKEKICVAIAGNIFKTVSDAVVNDAISNELCVMVMDALASSGLPELFKMEDLRLAKAVSVFNDGISDIVFVKVLDKLTLPVRFEKRT